MLPGAVKHLFSLDSPINGVCVLVPNPIPLLPPAFCGGVPGYPDYYLDQPAFRWGRDLSYSGQDGGSNPVFHFIGTLGDQVRVKIGSGTEPAYQTGLLTLQHELVVRGWCSDGGHTGCALAPDHVSNCPVTEDSNPKRRDHWIYEDGHFIEKFCPGNVAYVDKVLGLRY